jgi:hypothetical protein
VNGSSSSYAMIDGVEISEVELLRYEVARARAAHLLVYEKIGAAGMASLLKDEIAEIERFHEAWMQRSAGQWVGSITEIHVGGGSAEGFLKWFQGRMVADDTETMARAHPEHYAVVNAPDGRVSILETSGNWGGPSLVYARFTQNELDAVEPPDPQLPVRMIGVLETEDGEPRARVLHQFADTPRGFHGRLGIYWPAQADPDLVKGHQWHLACEFMNWTRMYLESASA